MVKSNSATDLIADAPVGSHICWGYDDPDTFFAQVAVYVSGGLGRGQRVACYFSAPRLSSACYELRAAVPGFDSALDDGALIVGSFEDSYLGEERFCGDDRIGEYAAMVDSALADGFSSLRVLGDAHPALDATAGSDEWPAYELRADLLAARAPLTALCTYDLQACSPEALHVLRAVHGSPVGGTDEGLDFHLHAIAHNAIAVEGEVDSFNSDLVGRLLVKAVADVPDSIVDVSALEFVDAAGVRAVARTLAAATGAPRIRGANDMFKKLWTILGCDGSVAVEFVA